MNRGGMEEPEETGTLGRRADLAAALRSAEDGPQAKALHALLAAEGVADGAALLMVRCGAGGLLAALREWYAVAGCDPHDARLALARRVLPGAPLWSCSPGAVTAAWPATVVVLAELDRIPAADLSAAVVAAAGLLTEGGLLVLLPGPQDLPTGASMMTTHDGDGLKIVRSAVARRSGGTVRLDQHWMVARDQGGVERFVEREIRHIHTAEAIHFALADAGLAGMLRSSEHFSCGIWLSARYAPAGTGA